MIDMKSCRLVSAIVISVTLFPAALCRAQDTTTRRDSVPVPQPITAPKPAPVPPAPPTLTIEQIRYQEGLRTATRGVTQLRDGLNRVARTQQSAPADSMRRRAAARRLGGLCGSARTFIASGRPRMQPTAYADSLRILAKQVLVRLDTLAAALPSCEKTAGRDPATVATGLTTRLKAYDDALLAFKTALAAQNKPDTTKTVSQQ